MRHGTVFADGISLKREIVFWANMGETASRSTILRVAHADGQFSSIRYPTEQTSADSSHDEYPSVGENACRLLNEHGEYRAQHGSLEHLNAYYSFDCERLSCFGDGVRIFLARHFGVRTIFRRSA
jgi:hypothetical protein